MEKSQSTISESSVSTKELDFKISSSIDFKPNRNNFFDLYEVQKGIELLFSCR